MEVILQLWCLFFGTDIHDLGTPEFRAREAASRRLRDAGLWAIPPLLVGMLDGSPERQMRCELLFRETGWDDDRTILDNLLWLRGKTAVAVMVITSRRRPCEYHEACTYPPEPFLVRVSENRAVCRRVFEVSKACGIPFYDPTTPGYGVLTVDKFLALTASERYWLLWDFGNFSKPVVPVKPEDVPRQMEKP